MPYIALQLIGMRSVLERSGIAPTSESATVFLVIAFALLAAYTFMSGLRAPAMIAFVKDTLIYITVIAAIIIIPAKLGGWALRRKRRLRQNRSPARSFSDLTYTSRTRHSHLAPPWRCSFIRTRLRACLARKVQTSSSEIARCFRSTAFFSHLSRCWGTARSRRVFA
jgi:Na+(H+)/acetate symporter ActP